MVDSLTNVHGCGCISEIGSVVVEFNVVLKGFDRHVSTSPPPSVLTSSSTSSITSTGTGDASDGRDQSCIACPPTKNKDMARMYS
jgi:hypothetical protein